MTELILLYALGVVTAGAGIAYGLATEPDRTASLRGVAIATLLGGLLWPLVMGQVLLEVLRGEHE